MEELLFNHVFFGLILIVSLVGYIAIVLRKQKTYKETVKNMGIPGINIGYQPKDKIDKNNPPRKGDKIYLIINQNDDIDFEIHNGIVTKLKYKDSTCIEKKDS